MPVGVVRRCDSEEKSANFASIFLVFVASQALFLYFCRRTCDDMG